MEDAQNSALIVGVSGQDGAYLAKMLAEKGYAVNGTSRQGRDQFSPLPNLETLGISDKVTMHSVDPCDMNALQEVVATVSPSEIYNLSAQSSVGRSFIEPQQTFDSIANSTLNLLEIVRTADNPMRLYNASSGECFGDAGEAACTETTAFRPCSPYAVSRAAAFWQVAVYREAYGLYACSGLLFNHESPLRPPRFVTRKIVAAAARIAAGEKERLTLGNLSVRRDWGWAPEYVDSMWLMLQQDQPDDFVIATGESHTLEEFVEAVFSAFGLSWRDHVDIDSSLFRPADIPSSYGDPSKAAHRLGWRAQVKMGKLAANLARAEAQSLPGARRPGGEHRETSN